MNRLQKIRARLAAITPEEWLPTATTGVIASDVTGEEHPTFICDTRTPLPGMLMPREADANRRFIANAPGDMATLLAIIDSLILQSGGSHD